MNNGTFSYHSTYGRLCRCTALPYHRLYGGRCAPTALPYHRLYRGQCPHTALPCHRLYRERCPCTALPYTGYIEDDVHVQLLHAPRGGGAADAEIKVPSSENTELKRSPFQAWSKSVYSHTYYAYCQGFLPCLFLHFRSIHLHFFPKPLPKFFLCWLSLTHGSCVGPQNKIGHPAGCRFPCWVPAEY